jgi:Glutamate synthase domain 1
MLYKMGKSSCGVGFVASIKGEKSNRILKIGLESVRNLIHRGAVSADGKTGDGAGIMTQIPLRIVKKESEKRGINLDPEKVAIGVFFLPNSKEDQQFIFDITESFAKELGFSPLFGEKFRKMKTLSVK